MEEKLVLRMNSIVKTFPDVKALDGVHLDMRRDEVHALCGENGIGKSTLMKAIVGAQGCISGHMYVNGEEVVFHSTKNAECEGIAMICQEFNTVRDLPMAENMYLGRLPKTSYGTVDWKKLYRDAQEELSRLGLRFDCRTKVCNPSVAESQMTETAECLTTGARVIIVDEPTAALVDGEIRVLFKIIAEPKAEGISILYISYRMGEIFQISDHLTVFRDGKYIATKDIGRANYDEVVSTMVGRSVTNLCPERDYRKDETVLELRSIYGKSVHNVSIGLRRGEILGVVGLLGSGTIELSRIVYGTLPIDSGEIYINEEKKDCSSPKKTLKTGIGFVSDDRKQEGLVLIRNIREDISLSSLDRVTRFIHLDKELETKRTNAQVGRLNIKISSLQQLTGKLSGSNQQKVVFAEVLEANPSILILDEPTRGVDVGAKAEIYQIMDEPAKAGKNVILISTDLPGVIGMSDRVVIMRKGHTVLEIPKSEMNRKVILAHAFGGVGENG